MFIHDKIQFDKKDRTVVSIRDGVMIYLGEEIGREPPDKQFKVYRSHKEVIDASKMLDGIPVTDEHINMDGKVENKIGKINSSEVITITDSMTEGTVAVKNKIDLDKDFDTMTKSEVSLGYTLDLIDCNHKDYDFEQVNIVPHHLAFVENGRCGHICNLKDEKEKTMTTEEMKAKISDMEKKVEDMEAAHQSKMDEMNAAHKSEIDEANEAHAKVVKDMGEKENEDGAEEAKEANDKAIQSFKDSDAFQKEVTDAANTRAEVTEKAKHFVAKDCSFKGKSNLDIMREAVHGHYNDNTIKDEAVPHLFGVLKATDKKAINDSGEPLDFGNYKKEVL